MSSFGKIYASIYTFPYACVAESTYLASLALCPVNAKLAVGYPYQGSLTLETSIGHGTTFTIRLPDDFNTPQ